MSTSTGPRPTAQATAPALVYFGNEWFAENRTSSHHIARRLALRTPVLYVDSPGMRPPSGSGRDIKRIFQKLAQALRPPKQVAPDLWHCTVMQLPWRHLPGVARLSRVLGGLALRRAMRAVGGGQRRWLLWFVVPHPAPLIDAVPHDGVVYYCIDDYASHPGVDADEIRRMDLTLTQQADHVFVAPPALVQAKTRVNPNTSFAPHGVDVDLFGQAQLAATVVPPQARDLTRPVIGYFGLIAPWTDVELVAWLAEQRPQWSFLMVGQARCDISLLRQRPNITLVGQQPYESLGSWAKAFDVALIPYRLNEQVKNANPLKLREYLATGKPVVSVDNPEIARFSDLVRIGHGREDILQQIEQALQEQDPQAARRRQESVQQMSWDQRAAESWSIAQAAIARKHGPDRRTT